MRQAFRKLSTHFLFLSLAVWLSGCVSSRLLTEQTYWLNRQRITGTKEVSKSVLAKYYQQQPNLTWFGLPFELWLYQLGQLMISEEAIQQRMRTMEAEYENRLAAAGSERKRRRLQQRWYQKRRQYEELIKEGSLLMRWGEPPVLYDPQKRAATVQNLNAYLQSKGYFDAQVSSTLQLHKKRATITYHVVENQRYRIEELRFRTADEAIAQLLQDHAQHSLLKRGDYYDQEVLSQERDRIHQLLSNHGYFNFSKQYIRFNVDNTTLDKSVIVETFIGIPVDSPVHPTFRIKEITVEVDANDTDTTQTQPAVVQHGITFKRWEGHFNPKVLAYKIPLVPAQRYRKEDIIKVRKSLSRLSMFKYVDITHKVTGPGELSSHIRVSLLDRYQLSNEFGLQVAQSLPLPFYKFSLQSRNFWGKLEVMSLAAHVHTEGVVTLTDEHTLVSSKAWGIDWSLSFPHFLLPLTEKAYATLETLRPTTKLLLGYDFVHRPEYIQHTFKTFINYTWQDRGVGKYVLTPLQIDLINTMNVSEAFHKRLEKLKTEGNNLYRTFNPSWVSHAAFRAAFCARPEDANKPLPYSHLQLYLETGGLLQNLFDLRKITRGLEYYQYVKFEVDYGQHIPLFFNTLLAYRFNFGIALPYGICKVLPYDRYYFAGGASGIRAWLPRTLGPGTYAAPPRPDKQLPLEEPGELLVQGSTELRQPLFGVLEGALFVDAGNVWMLQDDGRAGGQFRWKDAYKTIAVGIGVGARLNFSFLIVRLDAGIKLHDPARRTGQHPSNQSRIVYSLGVGYPY